MSSVKKGDCKEMKRNATVTRGDATEIVADGSVKEGDSSEMRGDRRVTKGIGAGIFAEGSVKEGERLGGGG